jgi:hypothetical protein
MEVKRLIILYRWNSPHKKGDINFTQRAAMAKKGKNDARMTSRAILVFMFLSSDYEFH